MYNVIKVEKPEFELTADNRFIEETMNSMGSKDLNALKGWTLTGYFDGYIINNKL